MQETAERLGFRFSRAQVAAAAIPNGIKSIHAYNWMVEYFNMIGDVEPAKELSSCCCVIIIITIIITIIIIIIIKLLLLLLLLSLIQL
jgi:hypothetical protein